jgi:hypothetical protein
MTRNQFLLEAEQKYWRMLIDKGWTARAVAAYAGVSPCWMYRRFKQVGIDYKDCKRNRNYGNGGNEAWRALADDVARSAAG